MQVTSTLQIAPEIVCKHTFFLKYLHVFLLTFTFPSTPIAKLFWFVQRLHFETFYRFSLFIPVTVLTVFIFNRGFYPWEKKVFVKTWNSQYIFIVNLLTTFSAWRFFSSLEHISVSTNRDSNINIFVYLYVSKRVYGNVTRDAWNLATSKSSPQHACDSRKASRLMFRRSPSYRAATAPHRSSGVNNVHESRRRIPLRPFAETAAASA